MAALSALEQALQKIKDGETFTMLVSPDMLEKIQEETEHLQTVNPSYETRGIFVRQLVTAYGTVNLVQVPGEGYVGILFGKALGVIP